MNFSSFLRNGSFVDWDEQQGKEYYFHCKFGVFIFLLIMLGILIRIIYTMDNYKAQISQISAQIIQGTSMCPIKCYPEMMFKCGFLFEKVNNFRKAFFFMEALEYVKAENKVSETLQLQIFAFLYENPEFYEKLTEILDQLIDCKPVNIVLELEKLQAIKDESIFVNKQKGSQDSLVPNNTILKSHKNEVKRMDSFPLNDIKYMKETNNDKNTLEEYDDEYFERMEKMNRESEELAKRLQEEEEKYARKEEDEANCEICYVGLYDEEFAILEVCGHIFHRNCLTEYFKAEISENRFPLKCPDDKCKAETKDSDIKLILEAKLYEKYEKHTLKSYAESHGESISWCPTANCEYMFFFEKEDEVHFVCLDCKKEYCLNCRSEWHKDMTCKEYQINSTESDADKAFLKFAKGKKFKQCPKCKFWVEKNKGCNHMTCKCKFEFCYKCGGVFRKCDCVALEAARLEKNRLLALERERKKKEKEEKLRKMKEVPKVEKSKRKK